MSKVTILAAGILMLFFIPDIKNMYDDLLVVAQGIVEFSDFELFVFQLIPFALLGLIAFGTLYKLFKGSGSRGDSE